ncbi:MULTISPECIES: 4-carboxymuconolactone decarboxylase [Micrococcaceae]|uniref:4-carboxymuconolactone decarboxylase n=1 Tax=Micrococcaceae TaxID=1268 RepID=UPI0012FB176C|nr:4-carboxymuconolactone decarboxylase [Pseudarthrobacter sp. GA104]MUU71635.1 4-carboxymuconolactone decarboxylase [Pseudarthrobacter sp. GA104]
MSGFEQAGAERHGVVQPDATSRDIYDGGMVVRREVLGDAHVDRANANKDEFTEDFQDMITRIAWGGIWTRPGLSRQMRSAVTITAMVAHGHWEELAMHIRAAVRNGLSRDEIKEILLQTAIYCGVPSANTAFKTAQEVFHAMDSTALDNAAMDNAATDNTHTDEPQPN